MSDQNEKIEAVQTWINDLRQYQATDPVAFNRTEVLLDEIVALIHAGNIPASSDQGLSETYADLERKVQEQTAAFNRATITLKSQINERETAARNLR
jgi:C4-dicarboxylate-specific signal transduction histidine kinase